MPAGRKHAASTAQGPQRTSGIVILLPQVACTAVLSNNVGQQVAPQLLVQPSCLRLVWARDGAIMPQRLRQGQQSAQHVSPKACLPGWRPHRWIAGVHGWIWASYMGKHHATHPPTHLHCHVVDIDPDGPPPVGRVVLRVALLVQAGRAAARWAGRKDRRMSRNAHLNPHLARPGSRTAQSTTDSWPT